MRRVHFSDACSGVGAHGWIVDDVAWLLSWCREYAWWVLRVGVWWVGKRCGGGGWVLARCWVLRERACLPWGGCGRWSLRTGLRCTAAAALCLLCGGVGGGGSGVG